MTFVCHCRDGDLAAQLNLAIFLGASRLALGLPSSGPVLPDHLGEKYYAVYFSRLRLIPACLNRVFKSVLYPRIFSALACGVTPHAITLTPDRGGIFGPIG